MKKAQEQVHEALADSFDTPRAVQSLSDLVSAANTYMQLPTQDVKEPLLRSVSRYVFHILKSFGLYGEDDTPSTVGEASQSREEILTPLMNALSEYRDKVKTAAKEGPKPVF